MGSGKTYEVHTWKQSYCEENYYYEMVYATDWIALAIFRMWKEKRRGYGCVKIEMR